MPTIVVASFFEEENIRRIKSGEDRVLYDPALVPPPRWPGDIVGERDWRRTPERQEEFLAMLSEADILLDFPRDVDGPLTEVSPGLVWVQGGMAGAGPVARAAGLLSTDVVVTTASGIFSPQLAEFVLGGMLSHAKNFDRLRRNKAEKRWLEEESGTLEGKVLCVIGTGSIGREISVRARPFGMEILGVKRTVRPDDPAHDFTDELYPVEDIKDALGRSDYIALTLPHTDRTEGLLDASAIAGIKGGAYLANVGRGSVLDEKALVEALKSGHLSGAALDVFAEEPLPKDSPLWDFDNVVISPHSTDNVPRITEDKFVGLFLENLRRYRTGEELLNVLDKNLLY